ncbi:transposase [Anaerobacillus alkaliphilus]|uniref:Transposase n=1 Tax=Anaerobacillus alkaliphilus TaxID=1548597 RepID=A0A4Q0VN49_9BACI|nr:transposase [Anaerobacillus alkaliphilus]RXI96232.1 transposase [Anaerobacillus alkaliphilus]
MENQERVDHDRLFKQLITTFFEEFVLAFFPDIYEHLDYNHMTFLHQEVFTDILKGRKGVVDILAETKLRGNDTIILVHIEPQSTYAHDFNDRMFFYFSRLYEKYRCPILPIAIFSYDDMKPETDFFHIHLPFKQVLSFHYFTVHLKRKNWRELINQPNPVALALLGKMGYDQDEKVKIKLEFLRMLLKLELDPARQTLVAGIFEKYHILSVSEENELDKYLKQIPNNEVVQIMDLMTSWEKKGFDQGIEKGIEKGMEKGIEKGMEEGIQKGIELTKVEVALSMLRKGLFISDIHEVTGLPVEEIKNLQEQSNI